MTTDELEPLLIESEGTLTVRRQDGAYVPVKTPVGYTDESFRLAVSAIHTLYLRQGRVPTLDEVHSFWPNLPKATYAGLMVTPELKQALEYRGVPWQDDSGLSIKQQMVLLKLADPSDRRKIDTKLKDMGIPMPTFQTWLKQPLFLEHYQHRTKKSYEEFLPELRNQLIGNGLAGDNQAIKLIFEITGEWNPAAEAVQDAREVVLAVVSAVVKSVKDRELRQKILDEIQAHVVGFDLNNHAALESLEK